jgi:hypothetical protein
MTIVSITITGIHLSIIIIMENEPMKDTELGNMSSVPLDSAAPEPESTHPPTSRYETCCQWTGLAVSAAFFVLFVASSTVQDNDTNGSAIPYLIYYALLAMNALCYILSHCIFTQRFLRLVQGLSVSMFIWSIVFLIVSSVQFSNTSSGGANAGGDNPNATKKQEVGYEIGGALLGALSCLFHYAKVRCKKSS